MTNITNRAQRQLMLDDVVQPSLFDDERESTTPDILDDVVQPVLFEDDYEVTIPDLFAYDKATPDSLENEPEQPGYTETAPSTSINQDAPEQSDVEPITESDADSAEAQTITPKPTKNPFGVLASWHEIDADAIIGQVSSGLSSDLEMSLRFAGSPRVPRRQSPDGSTMNI